MDIKQHIVTHAERVFDHHGFAATGMDRLTQAADVSSRTLYKHLGSKNGLIVSVLNARAQRFFASNAEVTSVDGLFEALERWALAEGARGCLFLRAQGETGGEIPEIAEAVSEYRQALHALIAHVATAQLGTSASPALVEQILVLYEGATSAVSYRGAQAVAAARDIAALLVARTT